MSYANGLSPFWGKINQFIIPVNHFKGSAPKVTTQKEVSADETYAKYIPREKNIHKKSKPSIEKTQTFNPPQIKIKKPNLVSGVSSLSLSSIALRKESERKSSSKKIEVNESQDKFSQERLSKLWKTYTQEKNNQGENNIAALLEMSQPELLADHKILLKTSTSLSKSELTKELPPLLSHLSRALNNYKITFEIKVETHKSEEFVYSIKEKYDYLKKINPEIEVLKNEFDLDI
ncbi:MAG: hypothetical protein ACO3MA_03020 [Flavobacteriaceae bacterium]